MKIIRYKMDEVLNFTNLDQLSNNKNVSNNKSKMCLKYKIKIMNSLII